MNFTALAERRDSLRLVRTGTLHQPFFDGGHIPYCAIGKEDIFHLICTAVEIILYLHTVGGVPETDNQIVPAALHNSVFCQQPFAETQGVRVPGAGIALSDRILTVAGIKQIAVAAVPAYQRVVVGAARERVAARTTVEGVTSLPSAQPVIA